MAIILQTFLTIVMGVIFQYVLMERRYGIKKTFIILVPSLLVVMIANAVLFMADNPLVFAKYYPLTIHLPVFLIFFCLSKYRGFRLLFNLLTAVFLCNLIALFGGLTSSAFNSNTIVSLLSRLALFPPILFFVIKIVRPLYLQMLDKLKKGWALFCLIPALSYASNYLLAIYPVNIFARQESILPLLLSDAIIIAAYSVIIIFFRQTQRHFTIQNEQQLLNSQVHALENQLNAVSEAEKKTTILHHDMRHYIQNIAAILKSDGIVAAMGFLGQFDVMFEQKTITRYCENLTINAILNYYLELAKKQGVTVSTHLEIAEKMPVDGIELSAVFANAIENALVACEKLPKEAERFIELTCISKPHFVLEIANTYNGEVLLDRTGLPMSREEGHGIGTRSIDAFAKKHNAILDYQTENGLFKLRILMN